MGRNETPKPYPLTPPNFLGLCTLTTVLRSRSRTRPRGLLPCGVGTLHLLTGVPPPADSQSHSGLIFLKPPLPSPRGEEALLNAGSHQLPLSPLCFVTAMFLNTGLPPTSCTRITPPHLYTRVLIPTHSSRSSISLTPNIPSVLSLSLLELPSRCIIIVCHPPLSPGHRLLGGDCLAFCWLPGVSCGAGSRAGTRWCLLRE